MTWVSSSPLLLVPLPKGFVDFATVPQTPLLAIATDTALLIHHASSLVPISVHERSSECLESHGRSVQINVRQVSVDTSRLDQLHATNVFVQTESNYILVYHLLINYSKSLYEIHDKKNDDELLQNSLPLALLSKFSLTSLLKSATKSILQGGLNIVNLENVEHFNNSTNDDEQRNDVIPLVKVSLVKILKMNGVIKSLWCKLNSQTLLFHNDNEEIQVLNLKTQRCEVFKLDDYEWFEPHSLVLYDLTKNHFVFVNTSMNVLLVEIAHEEDDTLYLKRIARLKLDKPAKSIQHNPQFDLFLIETDDSYDLYKIDYLGKKHSMAFIKRVVTSKNLTSCHWAPCGSFFVVTDLKNGYWKLISKFGATLFDSEAIQSDFNKTENLGLKQLFDFCRSSKVLVSPSSLALYIIDSQKKNVHFILLISSQDLLGDAVLHDQTNVSLLEADYSFHKVPLIPHYQRVLTKYHHINGTSKRLSSRKPTAHFIIRKNFANQLSVSYGDRISVSTPISRGLEAQHALWYNFVNHHMESMNIINHHWLGGNLVLINRFVRDDIDDDGTVDLMADEVVVMKTALSRLGSGGVNFRLDTDLIVWRHHFKAKILNADIQNDEENFSKLLVLITGDLKIVIIEFNKLGGNEDNKLGISIRRSIHLSSIQHKLAIPLIAKMVMAQQRHFFFLLSNGDLFLLKNQHLEGDNAPTGRGLTQTNNMYELVKICNAVETIHMNNIDFGCGKVIPHLTVKTGDEILIYKTQELVDSVYTFEGVAKHPGIEVEQSLRPIKVCLSSMQALKTQQVDGAIEVTGFEYQTIIKNEHLIVKHRPSRQLILNKFIQHDLFESNLEVTNIVNTYKHIPNFDYCLELLLFDFIDEQSDSAFERVMRLVSITDKADNIYVNLLRKIEICYWHKFFKLLNETPLNFMNRLIKSQDVELCYNYLIVYLNFKREYESAETPEDDQALLDSKDRQIILRIIDLLKSSESWDHCFELCRFVKLLEPSGELLLQMRTHIQ